MDKSRVNDKSYAKKKKKGAKYFRDEVCDRNVKREGEKMSAREVMKTERKQWE